MCVLIVHVFMYIRVHNVYICVCIVCVLCFSLCVYTVCALYICCVFVSTLCVYTINYICCTVHVELWVCVKGIW